MDREVEAFLERRFRIPEPSGDKTASLSEAIAKHVRPGDAVHLGTTHARGTAATWELLRQFHGADPGFTLLSVAVGTPMVPLVHAGLARKIVTSWAGDAYWTPGPSPVFQRAWKSGEVSFEHWSILTFPQRLAAAARGLEWTTTRSLIGSSMARDNAEDFREIEPGLALIRALVPDVSLFHAPAADSHGNVLMAPPLMENVYGALAARRGAVVTVERIVDSSFVREHGHLTRIPASAVAAVVEVPFGAHPGGIFPRGIDGVEAYGEDYDFWVEIRRASRDPASMDAWIKEWVLEPRTHREYLDHLGPERLALLRERARYDRMPSDVEAAIREVDLDETYGTIEAAIVAASRVLKERIASNGYTTVLAGAGMANLAAWLAAYELADEGVEVNLAAEMGLVGYWPRPGEPYIFNHRNFPTCSMVADIDWVMSILVGGGRARSIGSLGAAQVDKRGNLNTTLVPGEYLLMGSGGANDVATCASESVAIVAQRRERFVERVDYVTSPGDRISTLISTLGVYRKDQGEFVLAAVFGEDLDGAAREARERCGWDLRVARTLERIAPPTTAELRTLRLMDPRGWFRRES